MTGTLRGALAARGIDVEQGRLKTEVEGDIEAEDSLMLLTRVRLRYQVVVPSNKREAAERAVEVHHRGCPVYQSLQRGIHVEWTADIVEEPTTGD